MSTVDPFDDEEADAARMTTGASVLRGGVWNSASQLLPQAYTLVMSVVAARVLGPDDMGRQSYIAFVGIAVVALLTGGLPVALMRYIGELRGRGRPETARAMVRAAWRIELAAAALGGAGLVVAGLGRPPLGWAWALCGVSSAMAILHRVPSSVLIGMQRWRDSSVVGMVTGAGAAVGTVAVLLAGGGITAMFAVQAVVSAVNLLWTSRLARRRLPDRWAAPPAVPHRIDPGLRRAFTSFTLIATADAYLSFVVWRRTEFFFLERYAPPSELAIYSIAFAAASALVILPGALAGVVAPAVATLFGAGHDERIRSGFGRTVRLLVLLSLPITAMVLALGPAVLTGVYGADYAAAGPVLRIMMISFPLVPLVTVSQALLEGIGRIRFQLLISALAAATNLTLDVLLIPSHQARGAALANGLAQVVASLPLLVYAARKVGGVRLHWSHLARAALASVACGLVAWGALGPAVDVVGRILGLGVALAAGVLAFWVVAAIVKVLHRDDAAWLTDSVGERFGPVMAAACRWLA
ncbi:MAG: polysaccharide biosynthesis C-terminal domain-containing protein [Acidimicrobiales bacterium]|nr:polysaccharide biosynthesis C-terminal domain-containing protein [Acidimicrobiales bacterium]